MKKLKKYHSLFIPIAIITVIFGTIYLVAQQTMRLAANDPQVQMAHDFGRIITGDKLPNAADTGNVDIGSSLAPFVVIYNKDGNPVAGTGYLHGQLPKIPKGVLTSADHKSDHRVTWQPESGVRIASVTVAANDHYLVAGRSLKETEDRSQTIMQLVFVAWLVAVVLFIYKERSSKK